MTEGRSLLPATLNVFSSPAGKILFRRSHIRDVAVKRLIPIDEYCKVSWDASTIFPRGCSVCFPFWVPSVHGKVGNKIEQNIKFPMLLWNQPKSTFSGCVVLPCECSSQHSTPILGAAGLLLPECAEGGLPFGAVELDWIGVEWSGREGSVFSFPLLSL